MPCEGQLLAVHTRKGLAGWNNLFSNCALLHLWPRLWACTDGLNCLQWDWGLWRIVWPSRWNQGNVLMCQTLYIQSSKPYFSYLWWLCSVFGNRKLFSESIRQRWLWKFTGRESAQWAGAVFTKYNFFAWRLKGGFAEGTAKLSVCFSVCTCAVFCSCRHGNMQPAGSWRRWELLSA